jgi:hypothetical protein
MGREALFKVGSPAAVSSIVTAYDVDEARHRLGSLAQYPVYGADADPQLL